MCVQGEKKNELSNKSKQSNNNERFSLKVPRADWVSILNLKTRLSRVNFFTYRIEKGGFVVGSVIVQGIDIFFYLSD